MKREDTKNVLSHSYQANSGCQNAKWQSSNTALNNAQLYCNDRLIYKRIEEEIIDIIDISIIMTKTTLASSISRFARRSSRHAKINTLLTRNLHPLSTIPAIATTNNSAVRSLYNEHVSNNTKNDNIIDKDGYLQFNTLHEMISNATSAYDIYPLFGTFSNSTFNWMTYAEFANNVKLCRSVLKHQLGV